MSSKPDKSKTGETTEDPNQNIPGQGRQGQQKDQQGNRPGQQKETDDQQGNRGGQQRGGGQRQ